MSKITTHVLDVAQGRPAQGIPVTLERLEAAGWAVLARGRTDADGRVKDLVEDGTLIAGAYRLTFEAGIYFRAQGVASFYSDVPIQFHVGAPAQHYHVPLLLSPFGYSTYRGS